MLSERYRGHLLIIITFEHFLITKFPFRYKYKSIPPTKAASTTATVFETKLWCWEEKIFHWDVTSKFLCRLTFSPPWNNRMMFNFVIYFHILDRHLFVFIKYNIYLFVSPVWFPNFHILIAVYHLLSKHFFIYYIMRNLSEKLWITFFCW